MFKLKSSSIPLAVRLHSLLIKDLSPRLDREEVWAALKRNNRDLYWKKTKIRVMRYFGPDLQELESLVRNSTGRELSAIVADRLAISAKDVREIWRYGFFADLK